MKNILFVSYGGGHVSNLLPIYKEICHSPSINATFLALTTAQNYLDQRHVKYIGYKDLPFDLPIDNQKDAKILLDQIQNQPINPEESVAYLGWNMWDLEKQYGRKAAIEKYNKFGRACFYPINLMKKVLEAYSADLVVTTSAPRSEKAAIDAAVEMRIPSVCIPDSVANYELDLWLNKDSFATMICAANEKMRERLINAGRSSQSVTVTGSPALEDFMNPYDSEDIIKIKKKLGIPLNKKIILYASSPESSKHTFTDKIGDPELPKKVLDVLTTFVIKQGMALIYRPHPSLISESPALNESIILDLGHNLKDIISCSDVVVTTASTVGIQAQLLGKSLMCVNMSIYSTDVYYEDYGPCIRVTRFDEIPTKLDEALSRLIKNYPEKLMKHIPFSSPVKNIIEVLNLVGELQIDV